MVLSKDKIATYSVEKKGVYDFERFYSEAKEWAGEHKFFFNEKVFSMSKSGDGNEISWNFELVRRVDNYFNLRISVNVYIFRQVDVVVDVDGKKIKMNQGYVHIQIKPGFDKDYQYFFKNNKFHKFIQGIYEKYIIIGRYGQMFGIISSETDSLIKSLRKSLLMEIGS